MKFCPKCGSKLDEGAVFCGDCGCKLEAPKPEPRDACAVPEQIIPPIAAEPENRSSAINEKWPKASILLVAISAFLRVGLIVFYWLNTNKLIELGAQYEELNYQVLIFLLPAVELFILLFTKKKHAVLTGIPHALLALLAGDIICMMAAALSSPALKGNSALEIRALKLGYVLSIVICLVVIAALCLYVVGTFEKTGSKVFAVAVTVLGTLVAVYGIVSLVLMIQELINVSEMFDSVEMFDDIYIYRERELVRVTGKVVETAATYLIWILASAASAINLFSLAKYAGRKKKQEA